MSGLISFVFYSLLYILLHPGLSTEESGGRWSSMRKEHWKKIKNRRRRNLSVRVTIIRSQYIIVWPCVICSVFLIFSILVFFIEATSLRVVILQRQLVGTCDVWLYIKSGLHLLTLLLKSPLTLNLPLYQ